MPSLPDVFRIVDAVADRGVLRLLPAPSGSDVSNLGTTRGSNSFLAVAPAPLNAKRCALAIVIASFVAFCALVPFARVPLPRIDAFIPIYDSTFALNCLVTAGFLFVGFRRSRLHAVLLLACGYLFTSLIAIPHMLTFPGLFSSGGLLGAGSQTSAWLETFRHGGFLLFVICYALLKRHRSISGRSIADTPAAIMSAFTGAIAGVCLVTLFATAGHQLLPRIIDGDSYTTSMVAVNILVCLLGLVALVLLGSPAPISYSTCG